MNPKKYVAEGHDRAPIALTVCGDPVVGRALALLLRGYRYDARYLPTSVLAEPGALDGTDLLLMTAIFEPGPEGRKTFMDLIDTALKVRPLPVLQLVSDLTDISFRESRKADKKVPWPCTTEELQRRIEEVLMVAGEHGQAVLPRT